MPPLWLRSLIFFLVLAALLASQLFWFRWARRFAQSRGQPWLRWLLEVVVFVWFGLLAALFLLAPLRWLLLSDAPVLLSLITWVRQPVVMIPVGLWTTASMVSFLLVLLLRTPSYLRHRLTRRQSPDTPEPSRRSFLQQATYVAGALPFAVVAYGFLRGRQNYRVEEVAIHLPQLPAALDGVRLLQLTDIHVSAYLPVEEVRRVVALANELNPDLVFHTGDTLTTRGDPLAGAIAELGRLRARHGVFGCLGNHEIYARAEEAATELFARSGAKILRQQQVVVEINGARLNLIGVDYQRQPRGLNPERHPHYFLRGVEPLVRNDMVNILLSHNPNAFLRAPELGIDLTLSGHTHGGQVQVEILDSRLNPARFITRYISGLYRRRPVPSDPSTALGAGPRSVEQDRGCFLYVSRGIGTIAAPIRLGAPPEITLLTLRAAHH